MPEVPLFRISGKDGQTALKFAMWVRDLPAMRVIQVMDGVPIHALTQCTITGSRGSREHSAEIWCVVRPINYESYTAISM